ncbi:MAG: peptide deformylase [Sulfurimonas sp.]|uniref:peptide deformylase n=1 Tax=Sulfurimonas sp. TaxID=2022749 RepID=UPI002625C891|nr:peptide deformylase [Sulfurimonas sp.]MDD5373013.1 peptide deformylase [Sulfurimonas sp.]
MKLTIVEYPDRRLKEKSKAVDRFDNELHRLLDAMNEVMVKSNGIGLAAIQVGHAKQVLILNIPDENDTQPVDNLIEMINPTIVQTSGETVYQEGCLSVPSFYEDIDRHEKITVHYHDREGSVQTLSAEGLLSIAIQHEIDHLNGILFIDKLSYSRRKKFEKEYKRVQKEKKLSKA